MTRLSLPHAKVTTSLLGLAKLLALISLTSGIANAAGYDCDFLANDHVDHETFTYDGAQLLQKTLPGAKVLLQPYVRGAQQQVPIHQVKLVMGQGPSQQWSVAEFEFNSPVFKMVMGNAATAATIECYARTQR